MEFVTELNKKNRMSRQIKFEDIPDDYIHFTDFLILMATSEQLEDAEGFKPYLELIPLAKVKRAMLVLTTPFDKPKHEPMLQKVMDMIGENALLFVAIQDSVTLQAEFMQAISIRKTANAVLNYLKLNKMGMAIEHYDLKELKIYSLTLPWAPFFTIENCDEEGKNCDYYGFYADFCEAMGRITNYTWTSYADPDGNWGVRPISGPFNRSGTWGGAMGSVVTGDFQMSLSQWVWTVNRYGLLDFISTSADSFLLCLTPKPAEFDTGLFVRPFTDAAWEGIQKALVYDKCRINTFKFFNSRMLVYIYSHFGPYNCSTNFSGRLV